MTRKIKEKIKYYEIKEAVDLEIAEKYKKIGNLKEADFFKRSAENYRQLIDWLEELADIVHCEECIHRKETGGHANCPGYMSCKKFGHSVDLTDNCSWGERS